MTVQYLVGLCCLRAHPAAVDIIVGDLVHDSAAGKRRDVDVTVTLQDSNGSVSAFKAYEVKREAAPLDVAVVEQLCAKLIDMPKVTSRAIVSTSGYTDGARAKAARYNVDLYTLQPWTGNVEDTFPNWGLTGPVERVIASSHTNLVWADWTTFSYVPQASGRFELRASDPLFHSDGSAHREYGTFGTFQDEVLLRSTERLLPVDAVREEVPSPSSDVNESDCRRQIHTLDVRQDDVHIRVGNLGARIDSMTITGHLRWETNADSPQYHVMRKDSDGEPFAAAIIAAGRRIGQLFAFVLAGASETAGVHFVQLDRKHQAIIRSLRIENPGEEAVTNSPLTDGRAEP